MTQREHDSLGKLVDRNIRNDALHFEGLHITDKNK